MAKAVSSCTTGASTERAAKERAAKEHTAGRAGERGRRREADAALQTMVSPCLTSGARPVRTGALGEGRSGQGGSTNWKRRSDGEDRRLNRSGAKDEKRIRSAPSAHAFAPCHPRRLKQFNSTFPGCAPERLRPCGGPGRHRRLLVKESEFGVWFPRLWHGVAACEALRAKLLPGSRSSKEYAE